MPETDLSSLPFLTRKMLAFEEGAVFDLEVLIRDKWYADYKIIGATKEGPFTLLAQGDGSGDEVSYVFNITNVPLFITLTTEDTSVDRTDTYARVFLRINKTRVLKLFAGFIYQRKSLGWPITESDDPVLKIGTFGYGSSADPAAGAEITQTVPAGYLWIVESCAFTLITDATVATRQVHLIIDDGSSTPVMVEALAGATQAANLTRTYRFGKYGSLPVASANLTILGLLPNTLILPAGYRIRTVTDNLQAGDNYGKAYIFTQFLYV